MASQADTYNVFITSVAAGETKNIDARPGVAVIVRAGAGATVTVSAVDSLAANAHTTGAENQATVDADTFVNLFTLLGAHPFYRVQSAGGDCRVTVFP